MMYNKILNQKLIKKRSRTQTSIFDWFLVDFWIIFGAKIASKTVPTSKMLLERFQVASRSLLNRSLSWEALAEPSHPLRRRHFWSPNWSKIGQESTKNQKIPIPKPTLNSIQLFDRFYFKFWSILKRKWDQILIKF